MGAALRLAVVLVLVVLGLVLGLGLGACTRPEVISADLGGPCASVGNCTHVCLPQNVWPGGFCTRACERDTECEIGAVCATGVCLFSCFDDQDCTYLRDGLGCRSLEGKLVCAPDDLPDPPDAGGAHAQ